MDDDNKDDYEYYCENLLAYYTATYCVCEWMEERGEEGGAGGGRKGRGRGEKTWEWKRVTEGGGCEET